MSTDTCTCAASLDMPQPNLTKEGRCPACGKALSLPNTAIQTDLPDHADDEPAIDDVVQSIRMKSRASRGVKYIGIALLIFLMLVVTVSLCFFAEGIFMMGGGTSLEEVAVMQVKGSLTFGCQAYCLKHDGTFPPDLKALLVKDNLGGPYLEHPDALIDPWGNPYHYDIKGPRNQGAKPDIWAVSPKGQILGNWRAQR